jgi:hypothetical protein
MFLANFILLIIFIVPTFIVPILFVAFIWALAVSIVQLLLSQEKI